MPRRQADKRYRAKITIGHSADGKPIVKYLSANTQRELEEAKAAARAHFVDGAAPARDRVFGEYTVEWFKAVKRPQLRRGSVSDYSRYINNHVIPQFGDRMLRAIRPLEIQSWLNTFEGKSDTFLTMLRAIMRGVYASALAEGIVQRDPTVSLKKPKAGKPSEKRAFTEEEITRIEATIARHRHGLLLSVLYHLGVRRGEALGLQWGDIDWSEQVVRIQRDIDYGVSHQGVADELKSEKSDRVIPIPDDLYNALKARRGLPGVYVFSNGRGPYSRTMFQRAWMELMIDAGFATKAERPKNKKTGKPPAPDVRLDWKSSITPHYTRHNYATMLFNAGVDPLIAMRLLGHADYATTAKIYTHLNNMHIKNASVQIKGMFKKEKVAEKLPE